MKNILKSIVVLSGVHHACIYQNGEIPASTFPDEKTADLKNTGQMIEQIFSALKAIGKSHNEAYFSTNDKFLAAYVIENCCIVLLLTEKKINFPLVHMGVQSAAARIKTLLVREEATKRQQTALKPHFLSAPIPSIPELIIEKPKPEPVKAAPQAINQTIRPYMEQLLDLLMDDLGPAASFVFEDCVEAWQQQYTSEKKTLIHLAKILTDELDTKAEKKTFLKKAGRILKG